MALFFPIKAVVSQILLLLVTIAVEGFVLYQQLEITRRKSIEYSASINLLSTVLGWLSFLSLAPSLPRGVEIQLINLIFFDHWSTGTATWLITAGFITFFISFLVEFVGLEQLQLLLGERKAIESSERYSSKYSSYRSKRFSAASDEVTEEVDTVYAILIANACSYTLTVVLLFAFRFFSENQLISI